MKEQQELAKQLAARVVLASRNSLGLRLVGEAPKVAVKPSNKRASVYAACDQVYGK